jgi:hypothetical protein
MQEVKVSEGVTAGLFYHVNSEINTIVEVGSSTFVHMIVHTDVEESDDNETMNLMQEALAYITTKHDQKHGAKGKTVHFDGIEIPPNTCLRPQPASKQVMVEDEIILPEVQASSSKAKDWKLQKLCHIMYLSLIILWRELPWRPKVLHLHPHNQPHPPPIILHHCYPCPCYLHLPCNQLPIAMHSH